MIHANPSKKDIPLDIRVFESFGYDPVQPVSKPAGSNYMEVLWITKGKGTCFIDLEKFELLDNMILCFRPGQPHRLQASGHLSGYSISFAESFLYMEDQADTQLCRPALMPALPGSVCMVLQEDISNDMKDTVRRMMKEFDYDGLFRTDMIRRYLKIFLTYMARQFEPSFQHVIQTRNIEIVQQFTGLIDKNYITTKSVAEYAAMLFVTPNYLNTVVKKMTGYSAKYHIRQRIVLEAKRKATYSGLGMKEIAYHLGFDDLSHFSKYFKNASGINFSEFKKEKVLLLGAQ